MIKLKEGDLFVVQTQDISVPLYETEAVEKYYVIAHDVNCPNDKIVFNQNTCILVHIKTAVYINKKFNDIFRNQI